MGIKLVEFDQFAFISNCTNPSLNPSNSIGLRTKFWSEQRHENDHKSNQLGKQIHILWLAGDFLPAWLTLNPSETNAQEIASSLDLAKRRIQSAGYCFVGDSTKAEQEVTPRRAEKLRVSAHSAFINLKSYFLRTRHNPTA